MALPPMLPTPFAHDILKLRDGRVCLGSSHSMRKVFDLVHKLARVQTSVLIRGENGTGKELIARAIHEESAHRDGPFVAVNCAAVPENLIESEFFGHERGSFTGAEQKKTGKFQFASGGTLFLDEIGETSLTTQVKLLRVLQEHVFTPVGSLKEFSTTARIIAATNRDLEEAIARGKFREDLYYRLNVLPLTIPPLRERKEDIPVLVEHFRRKFSEEHRRKILSVSEEALEALIDFRWPGNIRELENAIEHAFIVETSEKITFFSLPEYIQSHRRDAATPSSRHFDWEQGKASFEREFIVRALQYHGGRINLTSERSRIPKNTLLRKMRKYNIKQEEYSSGEPLS